MSSTDQYSFFSTDTDPCRAFRFGTRRSLLGRLSSFVRDVDAQKSEVKRPSACMQYICSLALSLRVCMGIIVGIVLLLRSLR